MYIDMLTLTHSLTRKKNTQIKTGKFSDKITWIHCTPMREIIIFN